jgi:hypothetical protein
MTETETPAECGHSTLVLKADPVTTRQRLRDQFAMHSPPVPEWFEVPEPARPVPPAGMSEDVRLMCERWLDDSMYDLPPHFKKAEDNELFKPFMHAANRYWAEKRRKHPRPVRPTPDPEMGEELVERCEAWFKDDSFDLIGPGTIGRQYTLMAEFETRCRAYWRKTREIEKAKRMDRLVTWAYTYADAMLRQREEAT